MGNRYTVPGIPMSFNLGNAMKYIWRCDLKEDATEDLRKDQWYIDREITKRKKIFQASPLTETGVG